MLQFDVSGLIDTLGVGYYILVYGIGLLAMTLSVMAYQFPYRVTIILFNCFGQSSWVAHFLLQGDLTSAIACGLSAIMLAVFAQKQRWPWVTGPWLIALFIALIFTCCTNIRIIITRRTSYIFCGTIRQIRPIFFTK